MNISELWIFVIIVLYFCSFGHCASQVQGSCTFEGTDWLCGYQQEQVRDDFDWSRSNDTNGNHYMKIDTFNHLFGSNARLTTPEIKLQDTHCFTFQAFIYDELSPALSNTTTTTTASQASGEASRLNVYLLDKENDAIMQPVWQSDGFHRNTWSKIQLALNPRAYQIVFEAIVVDPSPGMIAIDDVTVSSSACPSTPHFLRLGDKEVNAGRNESLQCLLWGHSGLATIITLQKSTGEILLPSTTKIHADHMSAVFLFTNVAVTQRGTYRCLSGNSTRIGVSNYAHFFVRVPPRPKRGPKVVTPGATHFVIQLRSEAFNGDGPVVQTILFYRPVDGSWTDVHHITGSRYNLWNLQPDTEYELSVTLVRPGRGGAGPPGPTLRKKTKCGLPKSPVRNINFVSDDPESMTVKWDRPDFSITQCHNYAFVVKYRSYVEKEVENLPIAYQSKRVKDNNMAVIRGLDAFTKYWFKVETTNSAGSKETEEFIAETAEGVPDPVPTGSFVTTVINETAVGLKWDEPLVKNGVLRGYEVSYLGESSFDPNFVFQNDQGYLELAPNERKLVLSSLHPGTNYQMSIRAKTKAGLGAETNLVARTKIAAPTMPRYPPPSEANDTVTTPTSIEITIIPAQTNGAPITSYYVIVDDVTSKPNHDVTSSPVTPRTKKKKGSSRKGRRRKKKKNRKQRSVTFPLLSREKRQAVVNMKENETSVCATTPLSYEEAQRSNKTAYTPARFSSDEISRQIKFVVGDGSSPTDDYSNPALDPNKDYNIYVRVESVADEKLTFNCALVAKKSRVVTTSAPIPATTSTNGSITISGGKDGDVSGNLPGDVEKSETDQTMLYAGIGGAVVGILFITIIIILLVLRAKRRKKRSPKDKVVNPFEVRMNMSDVNSPAHTLLPSNQSGSAERQSLMPDVVGYEHQDLLEKASDNDAAGYGTSNDERFAVRVDDFHVHVAQMKSSGGYGFREEFSSLPDGKTAPWIVADSPQNRSKNRYGNIMAYDHSRVVLEPPVGHEEAFETDYINASYVNGYKNPSMYIAAQAPTAETSNDFWWMVWQEKTNVIVMVTNLVELGKRKCHKYWPEDRDTYGTVSVSLSNVEQTSDYVVRSFVLQQTEGFDVREVKQFHFIAWPDHGVPDRPTNLLTFIRRIKCYEPQGQGPTVVHCSAGSGRTGCFITIDMMLDMARDEDIVDINNTVRDLRLKRVNMVQNEEQYVFIHEAVLEALLCGETLVPAEDLAQHYDDLISVDPQTHFAPIQEEFETLNVITPKLTDEECSVARLPRNRDNNRFMDVLPADRHLAYLMTPDPADRENNYINALYVDSYSTKNTFLVAQMPLPNTVIDIWRLIYDHNCSAVVMMNDISEHDKSCAQYWPDKSSALFGSFNVELLTQDDEDDVTTRLFKLQNVSNPGEYRLIQQFQLTNWPASQSVPYSRNSILRIIQLITKWQVDSARNAGRGRILVHCVAGAGRSGTFISCYNMCEQLRHEYAVDVFNIVQRLRNVRPQLVETLEQYRFCYEVGIDFTER